MYERQSHGRRILGDTLGEDEQEARGHDETQRDDALWRCPLTGGIDARQDNVL